MTYNAASRLRNPVTVAELNDAQHLRSLASELDLKMDGLASATSRLAVMRAIQTLNLAARKLNP